MDLEMTTQPQTGRRARKAANTRSNILSAAQELMAHGGPESLTIAAIAEKADIGLGTFYNYFESRETLVDEVILSAVESLGRRLDFLTKDMEDAAEIYSFSLRHLMNTAVSDPLWGWLMVRLGIAQDGLLATLGPRASRDLQIGIDSGRFSIENLRTASAMTFGSLLSVMHTYLLGEIETNPAELYAENLLRMVGIPAEEAHEIANRPLPRLPELSEVEAAS